MTTTTTTTNQTQTMTTTAQRAEALAKGLLMGSLARCVGVGGIEMADGYELELAKEHRFTVIRAKDWIEVWKGEDFIHMETIEDGVSMDELKSRAINKAAAKIQLDKEKT